MVVSSREDILFNKFKERLSYDVTLDTRKTFARLAFSLNSFA